MRLRKAAVLVVVLAMVVTPAATVLGATINEEVDTSDENYHGEIYMWEQTLTVDDYDRSTYKDPTEQLQYEDDNGTVVDAEATVNTSQDNTSKVRYDRIDDDGYWEFPRVDGERDDNGDGVGDWTWLASGNWTNDSESQVGSASLTIADADDEPTNGVQAVEISTSSYSQGQLAANFSQNVSIDSDVSKRVLFLVVNVNTLNSGTNLTVNITDEDGDNYYAVMDTDANANDDHVIANGTGNGVVFQAKLDDLHQSGTVNEIHAMNVTVTGADADIDIVGLDVERKSKVDLGETKEDTDGDGDKETNTRHQVKHGGYVGLTELSTMDTEFSDAELHELKVNRVRWRVQDLSDEDDWRVDFEDASAYPSFSTLYNATYRLSVPTPIDLSHSNVRLQIDQQLVTDRYVTLKVAEDTGSTDIGNVSSSSYSDKTGSLTGADDENITLDSTITTGNNYMIQAHVTYTDEEAPGLQSSGGGAAPPSESGGGIFGFVSNPLTWLAGVGALVIQRIRGSFPFGG